MNISVTALDAVGAFIRIGSRHCPRIGGIVNPVECGEVARFEVFDEIPTPVDMDVGVINFFSNHSCDRIVILIHDEVVVSILSGIFNLNASVVANSLIAFLLGHAEEVTS